MHTPNRTLAIAAALVMGLMLTACGAAEQKPASLEVASIPSAEVLIDGASHGTTPTTVTLPAGTHKIVLQREFFQPHEATVDLTSGAAERVDAVLVGTDPADDEVIRILAEASEIEVGEFEVPEAHRGVGDSDDMAVLLWPQRDVRIEALTSYGIEVSLDYMGDGYLEFKQGRTVLHREPFEPERVTTVASMPETVRDALKANQSVTWGVVFDDKRMNVTGTFKVVKGTSAVKALGKLENRKSFQRQPPISQALMRAKVLENHRLYTEALLANLAVVQLYPESTSPYSGIVSTLRRLDAKGSELWGIASSFVRGNPGRVKRQPAGGGPAPGMSGPGVLAPSAPKGPIADYNPGPLAGYIGGMAGGEMPTPPNTMPGAGTPGVTPGGDLVAGPTNPDDVRELEAVYGDVAARGVEAERRLAEMDLTMADALKRVDEAERTVRDAGRDAAAAERRYDEAQAAYEADPGNPDLRKARDGAQRDRDEALRAKDEAKEAKLAASADVERLRAEYDGVHNEVEELKRRTEEAREAVLSAGGTLGPIGAEGVQTTDAELASLDRQFQEHGNRLEQSRAMLTDARQSIAGHEEALADIQRQLLDNPGDPSLLEAQATAQQALDAENARLAELEQESQKHDADFQAALEEYQRVLGAMKTESGDAAHDAKVHLQATQVGRAAEDVLNAKGALVAAREAADADPHNELLRDAVEDAARNLAEASDALTAAQEALAKTLDEE